VKFGSFYQKSVNIGEFEDIGRFQFMALKIGEFTEKSIDLASLDLSKKKTLNQKNPKFFFKANFGLVKRSYCPEYHTILIE
jgi:hypothetical protein